jgi:quercetin dioxygenase-like cupin family protein
MDTKGLVVLPGQAPICKMEPGRLAALKLQSWQTGESVMVFEEVMPAGAETPLHLHHSSDEVACVLSGEFTFKIGDEVSVGGPGTCAFMPRGIAHAWKNTGVETGRALFIYTPAEAGKLFEEDLMTWTDKSGANSHRLRYRYTQILKRADGKWLIWHEHLSVPYDPETGKAVLDAKSQFQPRSKMIQS